MSNKILCVERIIDSSNKLPKKISNRLDYINLVLSICRLLVNDDKRLIPTAKDKEKVGRPFLRIVENDNSRRAYVYLAGNKYFSIFFPYHLHIDEVGNISIYSDKGIKITDFTLSECFTFKEDMTDKKTKGIIVEKGKPYNQIVLDRNYQDVTYEVMNNLMTVEPSYVRYDHDLKSKNIKVHPIDHLDINFNSLATFKLGLKGRISPDKFEKYLSPMVKVLFCNEGSPFCYPKNKTLKSKKKNRKRF